MITSLLPAGARDEDRGSYNVIVLASKKDESMATLTLDLPADVYQHLHRQAQRVGQTAETLAATWVSERVHAVAEALPPAPEDERERAIAALKAAGLLTELTPDEKARARGTTATLEEVQAALARAGGKSISELVDELRGPKE